MSEPRPQTEFPPPSFNPRAIGVAFALVLFTLAAYLPAMSAQIDGFDDAEYITENRLLRSVRGLAVIWTVPLASPQYYPLTFTSFWIEHHLWGDHPLGYHLVNVLLHATSVILLWRLLLRLQAPGALLAAAIYAVHPVCVESVAWAAERKNVLSMALALGSILCYLRFASIGPDEDGKTSSTAPSQDRNRFYGLSVALYTAAMLAKTAVVALPAVLLVILWWKRGRVTRQDILALLPLFAIGAAMGLTTSYIEHQYPDLKDDSLKFTMVGKCLIAGRALLFYAGKVAWPYPLIHFYPRWDIQTDAPWQYLFPACAAAILVMLWLLRGRLGRGPLAAVLIFALTLAPALGFFKIAFLKYSLVSDHFQYHACASLIALAAAAVVLAARSLNINNKPLGYALAGCVLLVLAGLTFERAKAYETIVALAEDTIAKNDESWVSYVNVGVATAAAGDSEEGLRLLRKAYELHPHDHSVRFNLGLYLLQAGTKSGFAPGQLDEIIDHLQTAVSLKETGPGYVALGTALIKANRPAEAAESYNASIRLREPDAGTLLSMATDLDAAGLTQEAVVYFEQALSQADRDADDAQSLEAHYRLGTTLSKLDRHREAAVHLEVVVRSDPSSVEARTALGHALWRLKELRAAAQQLTAAVKLQPTNVSLLCTLAGVLLDDGQVAQARETIDAALQLQSDSEEAQALMRRAAEAREKTSGQ